MSWICKRCETENPDTIDICEVCDSPREKSPFDGIRKKYNNIEYKQILKTKIELLLSADKGDKDSQYGVGEWFWNYPKLLNYNKEDADNYYRIAVSWYYKAALQGHVYAQFKLARFYEEEYGIDNKVEALKWYQLAANSGNEVAKQKIIELKYDKEIYRNVLRYRQQLVKNADNGNANCQFKLGEWFISHDGNPNYKVEAFHWYQKAASQGHHEAMLSLASFYEKGEVVKRDYLTALDWYNKAANNGNVKAQIKLAHIWLYGKYGFDDVETAIKWFHKTGEVINPKDLYFIGICYHKGKGSEINMSKAFSYYEKAADNGHRDAQFLLGKWYEDGIFVSKDLHVAKDWYEKVANKDTAKHNNALHD